MEFNEKLQELRKGKGLTQEELAERLFVSRTAVSKWESGRGYPSIDSLRELSRFQALFLKIRTERTVIKKPAAMQAFQKLLFHAMIPFRLFRIPLATSGLFME